MNVYECNSCGRDDRCIIMGSTNHTDESLSQTSVRLFTADVARLKELARAEDRDVSYEIRRIIHEHLEAAEV